MNQIYFWQVISRDVYEAISANVSTWQFKTGDSDNASPYQPASPVPDDLAFDQLPSLRFSWTGGDPDNTDIVTYSFYLGLDPDNLQLKATTRNTVYEVEGLELGRTYYWKVIAADNRGKETRGPLWRFSTYAPANQNPSDPEAAYPASGAVNVATDVQLRWTASDPDGDLLRHDLYVGSSFPLTKIAADLAAPSFIPTTALRNSTKYYWQVVVKDSRGLNNLNSPVWSFTTTASANRSPDVPQALTPTDNAVGIALQPVFSWSGGDPDGDAVVYDFYLDTDIQPQTIKGQNLTEARWATPLELTQGTRYFWRVVARDSYGAEANSPVFSFFTAAGGDAVAPAIVSVTPAGGAKEVAQDSEIRVVFSEPVQQNTVLAALSLTPSVSGAWTWENDSTVRFFPSTPWLPGSYNVLKIAGNTVKDLAGNLMVTAGSYGFSVTSVIPVPSGFKSSGFPISATNGTTVNVRVANLAAGAKSYAMAIASPDSANTTVRASIAPAVRDPASAFREFEKNLGNRLFPAVMSDSGVRASMIPVAAAQIGVSESFYIPAYGSVATSTAFPGNVIQATCLGLTDNTAIYVDNQIVSPSNTLITEVRKRFEEVVLPRIRDVFGNEPSFGPDGESRLTILMTDSMADGIAGIFYGVDLFARDPLDSQLRESNARKIFYLKYSLNSEVTRYGTMAHEFQHMVNFWQKRYYGGNNNYEAVWLNEGLSKYAEEVCGYGILEGDQNTALLIKLSQENFNSLSLTDWTGLNSYGLSYLFVRFLAQENRYGTTYREITRGLVNSALTGTANVAAITRESFETTLARWGASIYLNRHTSTDARDYGLLGLNLAGTYNGVTLPGFRTTLLAPGASIDLALGANMIRAFEKTATGLGSTDMEFRANSGSIKIWTWDQRP